MELEGSFYVDLVMYCQGRGSWRAVESTAFSPTVNWYWGFGCSCAYSPSCILLFDRRNGCCVMFTDALGAPFGCKKMRSQPAWIVCVLSLHIFVHLLLLHVMKCFEKFCACFRSGLFESKERGGSAVRLRV